MSIRGFAVSISITHITEPIHAHIRALAIYIVACNFVIDVTMTNTCGRQFTGYSIQLKLSTCMPPQIP